MTAPAVNQYHVHVIIDGLRHSTMIAGPTFFAARAAFCATTGGAVHPDEVRPVQEARR